MRGMETGQKNDEVFDCMKSDFSSLAKIKRKYFKTKFDCKG